MKMSESSEIGSEWIVQLRPDGYNGFHFMQQITKQIKVRKERKIQSITQRIKELDESDERLDKFQNELNKLKKGEIPILAGNDDIPVSIVRPVLMQFAAELRSQR